MAPIVKKPAKVRDLGAVDADRLTAVVQAISKRTWHNENILKENDFDCFHHTQHLVFRFIKQNRDPETFYANPSWDAWKSVLLPVMEAASASYGFRNPQYPKAMLAKLIAGYGIDLHRDGAGSNPRTHKIHVPLITNPEAYFLFENDQVHLTPGRAWEVNNLIRHGGRNDGPEDRIHLIFEVFEGDYANAPEAASVTIDA
ncbi:hypothetical protein GCM10009127_25930 [Alteraurantiacibacter aestuarii]|uniref:aspartyl/asparaginyl beta-hydroxylase domain-containing protein n=1 Tax=Alteraurantiacibacter aestuarii TaxID=650004 RepID=UPI0031D465D5